MVLCCFQSCKIDAKTVDVATLPYRACVLRYRFTWGGLCCIVLEHLWPCILTSTNHEVSAQHTHDKDEYVTCPYNLC